MLKTHIGRILPRREAPLNTTLTKLILPPGVSVDDIDNEPVIQVMKENGIKTLFDFTCLTLTLTDELGYCPYGKWRPLPVLARYHLKVLGTASRFSLDYTTTQAMSYKGPSIYI
jgi:hypothetical protein